MKTKTWFAVLGSILILSLAVPATADGGKQGCSVVGSWIGITDGVVDWMATNEGSTINSGTVTLHVTGFDTTLGGMVPTAAKGPVILRGNWERVGRNRSFITAVGLATDADGNTVYVAKLTGYRTMLDDCNTLRVEEGLTLSLYAPTQNPFDSSEPPFAAQQFPEMYGYRMPVELPSE